MRNTDHQTRARRGRIAALCAALAAWPLLAAAPAEAQGVSVFSATCPTNPGAVVNSAPLVGGLAASGASDCPLGTTPSAQVNDTGGIAVGNDRTRPTTTQGDGDSIAVGNGAEAGFADPLNPLLNTRAATAIGVDATALGNNAVALGTNANAAGEASVAVGFNSASQNSNDISMGNSAFATGGNAVGVGFDATAQGNQSTAFGASSLATNNRTTAIGALANASGLDSTAIGAGSASTNQNSTAVGTNARGTGFASLALGSGAVSSDQNAIAVGANATANRLSGIALGDATQASNQEAVAIGSRAVASGLHGLAFGAGSQATNQDSIGIGANVVSNGLSSIAIGVGSRASGQQSISIGAFNVVTGLNSGAFGDPNTVNGQGSYAFGNNNLIDSQNAFVLGNNVNVASGLNGAVALGNATTVAAAIGTPSAVIDGVTYFFAGAGPQSTVSIGASGQERTLTNLAAGRINGSSTDAVNGSQLFALSQAIAAIDGTAANAVTYDDPSSAIVTFAGASGTLLTNVAAGDVGVGSMDAINGDQLNTAVLDLEAQIGAIGSGGFVVSDGAATPSATGVDSAAGGAGAQASGQRALAVGADAQANGQSSIAIGDGAQASGVLSISIGAGNSVSGNRSGAFGDPNIITGAGSFAIGNDNTIDADNAFALGNNITIGAGLNGAVALGNGSTVTAPIVTPSVILNGVTYVFAGATPSSSVSIGAAGQERTLTNLAAGQVSASSTDAVNGSQLFATNQALEALAASVGPIDALAVLYNDDTQSAITLGGASGTTISNVAAGSVAATSSDAVNGAQLHNTAASTAAALGGGAAVNADGSIAAPSYAVQGQTVNNVGDALAALDTQVTENTTAIASISSDIENGAIGLVQQAGPGADITVGAETDGARVDVGGTAGPRVVTNVAAGAVNAASTDAVNGAQLDQAVTTLQQQISAVGPGAFVTNASDTPVATGARASAGGANAVASGASSVALGDGAQARGAQSVALGAGSTDDGADNVVSVGSSTSQRRIVHVAAGVDASDAVNVSQLNAGFDRAVSTANAYTDTRFAAVGADMEVLRRDSEAGTAAAMALTGIPQSYRPGDSLFGVGVGTWQGEHAMAVGVSHSSKDGRVVLRAGGTYNSRSRGGVSAGFGLTF